MIWNRIETELQSTHIHNLPISASHGIICVNADDSTRLSHIVKLDDEKMYENKKKFYETH